MNLQPGSQLVLFIALCATSVLAAPLTVNNTLSASECGNTTLRWFGGWPPYDVTVKALISYPNFDGYWSFGVVFQQRTNNYDLIWPVDLYVGNTYTFEVSDATPATERSDSHTVNAGSGTVQNATCTKLHDAKISEISTSIQATASFSVNYIPIQTNPPGSGGGRDSSQSNIIAIVVPIVAVIFCIGAGLLIWRVRRRRRQARNRADATMVEATEAGAVPVAPGSDDDLPPYQRRAPPEVILAGPDPNREIVREQQTNLMRQYDPTTVTTTTANALTSAMTSPPAQAPGSSTIPDELDPFQDSHAAGVSGIPSSSLLRPEGLELIRPDSATSGQMSTRSALSETEDERDMLRIQVLLLQRQLDDIRGPHTATTRELPPAYEGESEAGPPEHPSP